jgi:hypothetical protein
MCNPICACRDDFWDLSNGCAAVGIAMFGMPGTSKGSSYVSRKVTRVNNIGHNIGQAACNPLAPVGIVLAEVSLPYGRGRK